MSISPHKTGSMVTSAACPKSSDTPHWDCASYMRGVILLVLNSMETFIEMYKYCIRGSMSEFIVPTMRRAVVNMDAGWGQDEYSALGVDFRGENCTSLAISLFILFLFLLYAYQI